MPRKPTWDDVPRRTDGRFAERARVDDTKAEKSKPKLVRNILKLFGFLKRKRNRRGIEDEKEKG